MLASVLVHIYAEFDNRWVTAEQIANLRVHAGPGPAVKLASLVYFGADEICELLDLPPESWVTDWLSVHRGYEIGVFTLVGSLQDPRMWRVVRAPKPSKSKARPSLRASRSASETPVSAEHAGKVVHS